MDLEAQLDEALPDEVSPETLARLEMRRQADENAAANARLQAMFAMARNPRDA